jgi:hypothetical protein
MKRDEIVAALRWLRPESGDFACEGCGWENSCGVHGCRIVREAADMLENDETYGGVLRDAIEKWKKAYGTLREKHSALLEQNGKLRDAAADVTRLAAEAAVERDWISVEDRLPEDRSDVLVVAYWHERWGVYMGWCAPERAAWSVHIGIGDRNDVAVTHWMPLPEPPREEK